MNPLVFTVIGVVLTLSGIVFTSIGSYMQSKKSDNLLDSISDLSQANYNLAEEVKQQADTFQQDITALSQKNIELTENSQAQANHFQDDIMTLTNKNSELSRLLLDKSEVEFTNLKKPQINLIKSQLIESGVYDEKSQIKLTVKNSGISTPFHVRLILDKHSSPAVNPNKFMIQSFETLPQDREVSYFIPLFKNENAHSFFQISKEELTAFDEYYKSFKLGNNTILITFHFEYDWEGETHKTNKYYLVRFSDGLLHISSDNVPGILPVSSK